MRAKIPVLAALCGLLMLAASPAAAKFGKGLEGSGDLETREMKADDFHAVALGGAFEVEITLGDRQKVEVTIDDNLWDRLELEVKGGELEIGWDGRVDPSDGCRVVITARSLDAVQVSGAADVRIRDFAGESFRFAVTGAAELEMDGKVDDLEIEVSGAGEIDTRRLEARRVEVRISGAGEAEVYASESVDARVSGVGDVNVHGDPPRRKIRTSGLGSVDIKD